MNIYQTIPPISETSRQLSGWLTSIHLSPRLLTSEERLANNIVDTITDENGEAAPQVAYTSIDTFYRHSKPLSESDYPHLVAAIIRSRYSADDVEAIQLNYINDRQDHRSEMEALQEWRRLAKEAAHHAIDGNLPHS